MKNALATILQFVAFLVVFGVFSFFPPFHLEHVLTITTLGTRIFIFDGLLLMFALYVLIVVAQLLMKRIRTATPWTTLAVIIAAILGLSMKFGFLTRSIF
jgi:hypothetical protein